MKALILFAVLMLIIGCGERDYLGRWYSLRSGDNTVLRINKMNPVCEFDLIFDNGDMYRFVEIRRETDTQEGEEGTLIFAEPSEEQFSEHAALAIAESVENLICLKIWDDNSPDQAIEMFFERYR